MLIPEFDGGRLFLEWSFHYCVVRYLREVHRQHVVFGPGLLILRSVEQFVHLHEMAVDVRSQQYCEVTCSALDLQLGMLR